MAGCTLVALDVQLWSPQLHSHPSSPRTHVTQKPATSKLANRVLEPQFASALKASRKTVSAEFPTRSASLSANSAVTLALTRASAEARASATTKGACSWPKTFLPNLLLSASGLAKESRVASHMSWSTMPFKVDAIEHAQNWDPLDPVSGWGTTGHSWTSTCDQSDFALKRNKTIG